MDNTEKLLAVVACQQAIHRFYAALDASDFAAVSAGMAPEGIWHRQGKVLQGPEQVSAALTQRPAGRTTAHLVLNLVVDVQSATTANASFMTVVYRVDRAAPGPTPAPLGQASLISLNTDRLTRGANGEWKMLEKRSVQKFVA